MSVTPPQRTGSQTPALLLGGALPAIGAGSQTEVRIWNRSAKEWQTFHWKCGQIGREFTNQIFVSNNFNNGQHLRNKSLLRVTAGKKLLLDNSLFVSDQWIIGLCWDKNEFTWSNNKALILHKNVDHFNNYINYSGYFIWPSCNNKTKHTISLKSPDMWTLSRNCINVFFVFLFSFINTQNI